MLNDEQKEEFVEDGLSDERRRDFRQAKMAPLMSTRALDELLKFLKDIREFSSPDYLLSENRTTRENKL